MNRTGKAKYSLFAFVISTIAIPFVVSNAPAYAIPRDCKAQYQINGKVVKGWVNLGKVGGFLANKKKKCKEKAITYAKKLKYNQVGFSSKQEVCDKYGASGGVRIYFDTDVAGKRNSRDGYVRSMLGVRCTRVCKYTAI